MESKDVECHDKSKFEELKKAHYHKQNETLKQEKEEVVHE